MDTPHPMSAPTLEPQWTGVTTIEATWGESSLLRIANEQPQGYDNKALPEGSAVIHFEIRLPFGWYQQVPFNPFEGADAEWRAGIIDYYDCSCGAWTGPAMHASGASEGDWKVINRLRGRDLALATPGNPYAVERWDALLASGNHSPTPDDELHLQDAGIAGLRADDGGWWIGINPEFTPRAWC